MKSLNTLLLGDGETWARQRVDFAGLDRIAGNGVCWLASEVG